MKEFLLLIVSLSYGIFIFADISSAQITQSAIDQGTRETDRPAIDLIEEKLESPPKEVTPTIEKETHEGPDVLRFFVKKIELIGLESFTAAEFRPLIEKYENRELILDDLNLLSKEIESEYLNRGIIAAVFVPPQVMTEGIVTLQVVEAKMGKLNVPDHKYFRESRMKYYWKIAKDEVLSYDKILKSLQLMNKNPDRKVTSTLHAGEKPETTDVTLKVDTKFPVHATGSFDKEGVTSTGINRYGAGGRHNNFLGLDDTFLAGSIWGFDFSSYYLYHSLPITPFGTTLLYGHSYSESSPKKEFAAIGVNSQARTTSIFLKQDLFKDGKLIGEVSLGFDAKDKTTKRDTGTINRDRLRILRFETLFIKEGPNNVTYFQPKFSQGVDAFGARARDGLSTREGKPYFNKFNLDIQHKRALPHSLQAVLQFKSQVSSNRLTPQEQLDLGGINSVRGYPASDFLADHGVKMSGEILAPAVFIPQAIRVPHSEDRLRDRVTMVAFLDYGWGYRRNALSTERQTANMMGIGGGLRIKVMEKWLLRMEWANILMDEPLTESSNTRFHISVDFES